MPGQPPAIAAGPARLKAYALKINTNKHAIGGDAMTKPEAYPVEQPHAARQAKNDDSTMPEALSGSKKVKNQNHTGQRHGEGS